MASFEMAYLLLLSLTPVYFCKLEVSGELYFCKQEGFFKLFGRRKEKGPVLVRTNRLEQAFYTRQHLCGGSLSAGLGTNRSLGLYESCLRCARSAYPQRVPPAVPTVRIALPVVGHPYQEQTASRSAGEDEIFPL